VAWGNTALMVKSVWRLFSEENNDLLWVRLLRAKYRVSEFFSTHPTTCSPFWHSLHKIKQAFKLGAKFHLGRGSSVSFWKDVWLGKSPWHKASLISSRNVQTQA
jgi:hypothetical protein